MTTLRILKTKILSKRMKFESISTTFSFYFIVVIIIIIVIGYTTFILKSKPKKKFTKYFSRQEHCDNT